MENKLLLVPVLFVISRLFGMLRYAVSLPAAFTHKSNPNTDSVLYNPVLVGLHVSAQSLVLLCWGAVNTYAHFVRCMYIRMENCSVTNVYSQQ